MASQRSPRLFATGTSATVASTLLLRLCRRLSSTGAAMSSAESHLKTSDERSFRVFSIPGRKSKALALGDKRRRKVVVPPPRSTKMEVNQDWSIAWPTASTFKWSVAPFPVRQGFVENLSENGGIVPAKYANAELMKIPNFFHLSPAHIKKQCDAIKQFCTEWPADVDETRLAAHFPVEVTTTDYCYAGPSLRDSRARAVSVKVNMGARLRLSPAAEEKLRRLAGHRYDRATKVLTLAIDRCPLRKQNYDYAMYLLTALYHESRKVESWESEKTADDLLTYSWQSSQSEARCLSLLQTISKEANVNKDELLKSNTVVEYSQAVENLHNQPETIANLNAYKASVLKLLKLNTASK